VFCSESYDVGQEAGCPNLNFVEDAGDDSWNAALNLPTLYDDDNLREWLTAHCQSLSVLNRVKEVTKLVANAIAMHTGAKAFRTARGTEKQKVDVDLAFHCPNAASVKTMKDLLGPELAKRVEWERTKHVDHKHDGGTLSRRIFASIVLKEHPHLPVDIALFADQRDFDLQGEVLNRIQLELNYHPPVAQLAVAMKGILPPRLLRVRQGAPQRARRRPRHRHRDRRNPYRTLQERV